MKKVKSTFPKPVYLGGPVRTPIGKFAGSLAKLSAANLAALALKECVVRSPCPEPDFVLLGHARQAGAGPNPARQAVLFSGLSETVPAITLNQACASGMSAVILAAEKIALGRSKTIYAGGVEAMSQTPFLLSKARFGLRMGHTEMLDGMWKDGFYCPMSQMVMGETVEKFLAQELGISRGEQDEYALLSQSRAEKAWAAGYFKDEVFSIQDEKLKINLNTDEHRRGDATLESLRKLSPVFDPVNGSVTAGNSSGITDGAAFICVSDQVSSSTFAELIDYETIALDPKRMGLGPVWATQNLLKRQGMVISDLEAVELNEAFAAQVIACNRELKIPMEKLNVRGGAIALGHPIGATGCRILVTLLHCLKGKSGALGLATLCVSGGQGVAVLVRAV